MIDHLLAKVISNISNSKEILSYLGDANSSKLELEYQRELVNRIKEVCPRIRVIFISDARIFNNKNYISGYDLISIAQKGIR